MSETMAEKTLKPEAKEKKAGLYFIWWDPRITEEDVCEALASDNLYTRVTYMSYILNDARFEDIWKFLTLKEVRENFWRIRWRTDGLRNMWQQILTLLGYPPDDCADPRAARILD
jgi:hypothetical protein